MPPPLPHPQQKTKQNKTKQKTPSLPILALAMEITTL